jgi:predicted outer membrane repeat protein
LENVTITGNVASNQGGAISTLGIVTVRLTNCIAWDNFPNDILPGVVSYSDVQGGKLGAGNIDDDPMFVSTNDWHLRAGSPCIDAGTNLASPVNDTDIDGQPRVFNDHVDMGADEAVIRAADFSVSNGVETVWDTVVDARCELQCCTNLVLANWYPASSILTCQQTVVTICDTQAINSCGFYRLRWHRP